MWESTSKCRVIYGGSFFPPHKGHDSILETLVLDPLSKCVHVVPTGQNPFKETLSLEEASFRRSLVLAWMSSWTNEQAQKTSKLHEGAALVAETHELLSENIQPNYTINSLMHLKNKYPNQNWAMVVGDDQLEKLHEWKHFSALCSELRELWVFRRLHAEGFFVPTWIQSLPIRWMTNPLWDISATKIRDNRKYHSEISPRVRQLWNSRYRIGE